METVAMIVQGIAKPGRREDLFELYSEQLAPRADENDGQQLVVWAADQHDPDGFFLMEAYTDAAALAANAQSEWFASYMEAAGALLEGQPNVSVGTPLWSKGL